MAVTEEMDPGGLAAVVDRAELCAKWEYEYAEPVSDPSMLDLGEWVLPPCMERLLRSNEVRVAAAFMSTSPSASTLAPRARLLCLPFALSRDARLALRLSGDAAVFLSGCFAFAWVRLPSAADLGDGLTVRTLGDGAGRDEGGTGWSLAFRTVRATCARGAKMEAYKLAEPGADDPETVE
jgi:hypothetical protein